jgi:nucleoside-diphosphate-sugar epimerase
MRIAITGGNGRIGRAVTAMAVSQGHAVVCIDRVPPPEDASRPGVTDVQAEVTDYAAVKRALTGCDGVVHLAAIPSPLGHPDHEVHNNNVVGSYNLLSVAAELGIRHVCQASSINAIGGAYSRWPRYDYFPVDEGHPTYNEDPYSLSKWICEMQGDSFARRYETMSISSLRFHGVVQDRAAMMRYGSIEERAAKHLWGYTRLDATARACLLALSVQWTGHEVFYIVAPDTAMDQPSRELAGRHFPDVPIRGDFSDRRSFFDCAKAERLLGWSHNESTGGNE